MLKTQRGQKKKISIIIDMPSTQQGAQEVDEPQSCNVRNPQQRTMCYRVRNKPWEASCKSRFVLGFKGWLLIHQKGKDQSTADRREQVLKERSVTAVVWQPSSSPTNSPNLHVLHLENCSRFSTTCFDTVNLLTPLFSYPQFDYIPHHSKGSMSNQ